MTVSLRAQEPRGGPLKIVVIEGEGAVNIIQQKTAVAPMIEVRDRNDQPVAGATVNFAIRAGRATFSGARTLTVTTNAAGRAAAAGFTPSGAGALQIGATATFQGQTAAAVTIAQTNVMTAAEAAAATAASGAGGSGSGAAGGGAGAGGGGGLSTTTLAVVGGAIAGGAIVAKETVLDSGTTYKGQFSGVLNDTIAAAPGFGSGSCTQQEAHTGSVELQFDSIDGAVNGVMTVDGDVKLSPGTCPPGPYNNGGTDTFGLEDGTVTGARENVTGNGHAQNNYSSTTPVAGSGVNAYDFSFTGRFDSDDQISGSLTVRRNVSYRAADNSYASMSQGSVTYQVTLRKQ